MNILLKKVVKSLPQISFHHSMACDCEAESLSSKELDIDIVVNDYGLLNVFCNSVLQIRKTEDLFPLEAIGIIKSVLSNQ